MKLCHYNAWGTWKGSYPSTHKNNVHTHNIQTNQQNQQQCNRNRFCKCYWITTTNNVQCSVHWAVSTECIHMAWWTSHFEKSLFDFEPFAHIVSFMLQCRLRFGFSSHSFSQSWCRRRTFLNFFAIEAKERGRKIDREKAPTMDHHEGVSYITKYKKYINIAPYNIWTRLVDTDKKLKWHTIIIIRCRKPVLYEWRTKLWELNKDRLDIRLVYMCVNRSMKWKNWKVLKLKLL